MENIEQKHWFNNKQVITVILFFIMLTFYVTVTWMEFETVKVKISNLEKKIEYVNDRVSRKIK